ncbi:hypothetical protein METBIDRAFT_83144 [Metschnikowia bicuspidata var. bicuspidata NRRL YB-4993]|uniref:Histone transcription regulator 3 homolog n=1 Tax=Metschnikowia bicuspidata var. bicuspidata NRRL YB-4993 TaxID=869754 RepID=A0A1A0HC29_9ASCO|nr:hypothetical protein METBIDRAFT_83144 [Metschnikowia bicuspidata var. bicuspidata NRRL YB-4993]OBA21566.1 hypothetical protein METBIDRAFT_83144 [Metschnikowia bicuspidata var. bicuspidata NRRL YB-4993]
MSQPHARSDVPHTYPCPKKPHTNIQSAFSPLNLVEDVSASKKDLEEEHTRELEIENAYKLYQEAIALQSKKLWVDAYKKYKELASSAVVTNHFYEEVSFIKGLQNGSSNLQPEELSFIPQNVKKIRFLFFRNRGFLHFNILKAGSEILAGVLETERETEPALGLFELQKDLFYTMLDGFVNCLVYEEGDDSLLRILFEIYTYLGVRRLAKFALEYCISYSSERNECLSISCLNDWAEPMWRRFKKLGFTSTEASADLELKFVFLLPLKQDFLAQMAKKMQFHTLSVSLKPGASWFDVINSINGAMRENQDKERLQDFQKIACKHFDPYVTSDTTFDDISFEFSEEKTAAEITAESEALAMATDMHIENVLKDTPEEEPQITPINMEQQEAAVSSEKASMRLSKRLNPGDLAPVEMDDILLIRQYFVETELFFKHLNELFKTIYGVEQPVLDDMVGHIVNAEIDNSQTGYIDDFLKILNEWKSQKYDAILFPENNSDSKRKSHSDKKRLIDVLTSFGNQFSDSKQHFGNLYDSQDLAFVKEFISKYFCGHCHVNEAKIEILLHLLASITELTWDDQLYDAVTDWAMQLESSYFEMCEQSQRVSGKFQNIKLAMGIYEILVNCYIVTQEKLEQSLESGAHTSFVKSVKSNFNTTAIDLLRMKDRIDKWWKLFQNAFSSIDRLENTEIEFIIRFYWASNYYVAAKSFLWREKKFVVVHLHKLAELLTDMSSAKDVQISYPNYSKIGEFSIDGLHRRLSTTSILSVFSKILDQSDSETITTKETISLLESILFDEHDEDSEPLQTDTEGSLLVNSVIHGLAVLDKVSLSSVKDFFSECPVDLKLSLWNILLLYYQKESFQNFQKGLENYLQFVLDFLGNSSYKSIQNDKQVVLLSLISCYRSHLGTFLKYLSENKWQLPSRTGDIRQLSNVLRIYEICYIFSLHEEGALYTSRKVSLATKSEASFEYFKDFFIDCITILLTYCFNYITGNDVAEKNTLISNFLIFIHHQIGLRHLCDSSKGLFLKFAEDSLVSLSKIPETELTQIMSCRYHYKVKLYGQFPVDHYTVKSAELNKKSAQELAIFILPLCFKTNPLTQTPRNDLKQVVDDLFEIIGDPDVENDRSLCENMSSIEKFIDRSLIGARFIKESFYGLKSLEMLPPQHKNRVAEKGLYFMEAVLMFNSYKIRKKSAQSRTVELERIITVLTYDLIYGSDRVESWILLAQAYSFIVEDDLIWTSDKIGTIEKKVPTANLQRKALICYLMAISTITKQRHTDTESIKLVMSMLMNSFAKELYSASRSPMDMLAFQVHCNPKFVRQNEKALFLKVADRPSVTQKYCLVLMNRCLDLAVKNNCEDWNSLYYSAKVKAKLDLNPTNVLETLIQASDEAKKQSLSGDPVLEPAYKFLSLLYKFVKSQKLSLEEGMRLLNLNTTLTTTDEFKAETKSELFKGIISGLKILISLDKKAWYHKPAYRQAKILFTEFNDHLGAKELLSKYFTLRSSNKTFLVMWKPEFERPGKHFEYMNQYSRFYIMLLGHEQDLTSLVLMYPKLRRANSTMTLLVSIWGQLCTLICTIIRKVLDVDPGQEKYFLYATTYSTFIARAKKVVEMVRADQANGLLKKNLSLLHILTDIRKLNNGFGPTALIDNTFSGVFIEIYREICYEHKEIEEIMVPDSPNAKTKRLAKKDLFPFAIELATKCKRDTDLFLKLNPDILNFYVTEYEKKAEIMRQKKAEEEERQRLAAEKEHRKREEAEQERQRMAAEQERQRFSPQTRLLRLFAEQLLLRGQKKAMYKMLAATMPMSWHSRIVALDGIGVALPCRNSIELIGPEKLATNFFNEARRYVRVGESPGSARLPSSSDNANVAPVLLTVIGNGAKAPSISTLPATTKNTIEVVQRELRSTQSHQLRNHSADPNFWLQSSYASRPHINQRDLQLQQAAFQGTQLDPFEIDSQEGTTPGAEHKRQLETEGDIEALQAKRQNINK